MKKFLAGVTIGLILATTLTVFADSAATIDVIFDRVKLIVNGDETNTPTMLYDGRTYIQLRGAAEAFGALLDWDGETNTAALTAKTLAASVDIVNPTRNTTIRLMVSGAGYEGKPYEAIVFYKTTNSAYNGIVGEPCAIRVGSVTPDWRVQVVVTLESGEQTVTSFIPK